MHKIHIKLKKLVMLCMIFFLSCSTIPDTSDSDIVIPFVVENGLIVLDAVFDGITGRFFWDTGANFSTVPGANSRSERWYHNTVVDGERMLEPFYQINCIRFGDVDVRARSWYINIKNDFSGRVAELRGLDGMLGNSIFEGFWVELSFSRNEIVLHREMPAHFANANHVPLKSMLEISGERDDKFYLPIDIDGKEFFMLIDTGAYSAFASPNDIVNYKSPDDIRRITSNAEPLDYYLVRTNSITVLDRTYLDKFVMTNSWGTTRTESITGVRGFTDIGIIDTDFMRHYDFLMDYRDLFNGITEGMFFIPITPPEERDYGYFSFLTEVPELGILTVWSTYRGLVITSILSDSPAYTVLGLRPGSIIAKINGESVHNFSRAELLDLLFTHKITNLSVFNAEGSLELILVHN